MPCEVELNELTQVLLKQIEDLKPTRVVIDSLSEMRLLARDPLRYRRQILALREFFANRQCTVLLLDDHAAKQEDLQLRSLAHGVVSLEHRSFEYGRARRRLRIVKLRGMAAIEGFHDFAIVRGGLVVYPQLVPDGPAAARTQASLKSGVAALDDLLGGGLTWGTTTLFIGPAGVGKSTVAAQYLCCAANPKARSAVFLFDERQSTFIARCDALGMHASDRIKSGHMIIEQVDPGATSPGEFSHRVRRCVEEQGVRMIGLDTLNGYVNAIPTTDTPIVRMHELLSFLNERSVATIVVLAQHGIVGSAMAAPVDLSYLADAIVMFRYFEAFGEVRKAISVVKKRTGKHENSIREMRFGDNQVHVGEPLTAFQGVLTGVPQFIGGQRSLMVNDDSRAKA